MTIKYIHVRDWPMWADVDADPKHTGGFTVAYDIVCTDDGTPHTIHYALALCSRKDRYIKARGRMIAGGRLRRGTYVALPFNPDPMTSPTVQILVALAGNGTYHVDL